MFQSSCHDDLQHFILVRIVCTAVGVPGEIERVPCKAPSHGVISTILSTSMDGDPRGTAALKAATSTRTTRRVERGQTKAERENARLKEQLKFQVRFCLLQYSSVFSHGG